MTSITDLQQEGYTGLSYDGGRTSLPYAVWIRGLIGCWAANILKAERILDKEVRRLGIRKVSDRTVVTG